MVVGECVLVVGGDGGEGVRVAAAAAVARGVATVEQGAPGG